MKKSLDLCLVSLEVALFYRAISTSFLKSLCKELSESMVGSSGIQFFTRLYLGEQCHWTQNQSKLAILVPNVAKKIFKRCLETSAIAYSKNEGLNFQNHTECTG